MNILEYNIGKDARAFSTMRGEGSGNYGGFNITHYCGDEEAHVKKCRAELCNMLGITDERLVLPRQTHGCNILSIGRDFMELGKEAQQKALYSVDALITALPGVCIGVSTADCIPVLLHDSTRGVSAAVHAGWRGTVAGIAGRCVGQMCQKHGCNPADIKAVIAPGISLAAFEVGDEVYNAFEEAGFPMKLIAKRFPAAGGGTKWHIDLWEANRLQLTDAGISSNCIHTAGVCTLQSHMDFFSARRLGINSGRIFNGIINLGQETALI